MAEYKNEEPCEFIYSITAIEKVVDVDTIDAVIDLGFDVRFCGRIRMLGIDTPESRTRDLEEKFYANFPQQHSNRGCIGQLCRTEMISKYNYVVQKRIVEENSVES